MTSMVIEMLQEHATMADRMVAAAKRIQSTLEAKGNISTSARTLRPEQMNVYADCAGYLVEAATRAVDGSGPPMGRIILPPRTGKTVIAGQISAGAGLITTFIVPTKTLVEQAAREFREQFPNLPVGVYYGEVKALVVGGINVTTYQILQRCMRAEGALPWQLRHSAIVFADEGHRAMTTDRLKLLREGFDPLAVRIALTATPQYDEERTLGRYFPDLIHEITVAEAVELDLLAPLRVWVAEVDEDASQVEVIAGELQGDLLGKVMSAAPFFEAARAYRYAPGNIGQPALICCASRQQAYDLHRYLCDLRPDGMPVPELILGDTLRDKRERILGDFERGIVDTVINVAVLLEGWNSPRCKLLVDLAPSLSHVRAMQKFFRPMTKWEGKEARIYLLIPKNLPRMPVLPMELFGWPTETYEAGELIAAPKKHGDGRQELPRLERHAHTPIEKVELVSRIRIAVRFEKPKLDPQNLEQVRQVLESNPEFRPGEDVGALKRFRWVLFNHPLFAGRGEQLLRFLGIPMHVAGFVSFMGRAYPEGLANRFLRQEGEEIDTGSCYADALYMEQKLVEPRANPKTRLPDEGFVLGWGALAGLRGRDPEGDPHEAAVQRELREAVREILGTLTPREEKVLRMCCGIGERREYNLEEIGKEFEVSRERVRQIEAKALRKLRHPSRSKHVKVFVEE